MLIRLRDFVSNIIRTRSRTRLDNIEGIVDGSVTLRVAARFATPRNKVLEIVIAFTLAFSRCRSSLCSISIAA